MVGANRSLNKVIYRSIKIEWNAERKHFALWNYLYGDEKSRQMGLRLLLLSTSEDIYLLAKQLKTTKESLEHDFRLMLIIMGEET